MGTATLDHAACLQILEKHFLPLRGQQQCCFHNKISLLSETFHTPIGTATLLGYSGERPRSRETFHTPMGTATTGFHHAPTAPGNISYPYGDKKKTDMSNWTYRFLLYPLLLFTCYAAHTERRFNADTRIRCKVQQQVRHRKMKPSRRHLSVSSPVNPGMDCPLSR